MTNAITVHHGRVDTFSVVVDPESGETMQVRRTQQVVTVIDLHGVEYTHTWMFADDATGRKRTARLAARVCKAVAERGIAALDQQYWYSRTIYGSQAYQDEEPAVVEREQADDLLGF